MYMFNEKKYDTVDAIDFIDKLFKHSRILAFCNMTIYFKDYVIEDMEDYLLLSLHDRDVVFKFAKDCNWQIYNNGNEIIL